MGTPDQCLKHHSIVVKWVQTWGGVTSPNMHKQTCIPHGTQLTERQESVSILHIYTQVAGISSNFGFALEI